ncbi:MAG: sensor histidine kinase [Phycisphaerales bacterium]
MAVHSPVSIRQRAAIRFALTYVLFGVLWILLSDRALALVVEDAATITRAQTAKGWFFVFLSGALIYGLSVRYVREVSLAEEAAKRSRLDYRNLVETSNEGIWVTDSHDRTVYANERWAQMLGAPTATALIGSRLEDFIPSESRKTIDEQFDKRSCGESGAYEIRFTRADGSDLWTLVSGSPIHSRHGDFDGCLRMLTDITDRRRTEEALRASFASQKAAFNELDHRVRNNLASILSLIDLAQPQATGVEDFAEALRGRILALVTAHTVLSEAQWSPMALRTLCERILPPERGSLFTLHGPAIEVAPDQIAPLTVILSELATNSVEHGAARDDKGRIEIEWSIASQNMHETEIELEWREFTLDAVEGDPTKGVGLALVEGIVRYDLGGAVTTRFEPTGVRHDIRLRLRHATAAPGELVSS